MSKTKTKHDPADLLQRLLAVTGEPDKCRRCGADVLIATGRDGASLLLSMSGVVHWMTCSAYSTLARLLRALGKPGRCKTCGRQILWITTKNGKPAIYDPDGVSHWATCPTADQHRQTQGATDART